jgi:hypothetical protein
MQQTVLCGPVGVQVPVAKASPEGVHEPPACNLILVIAFTNPMLLDNLVHGEGIVASSKSKELSQGCSLPETLSEKTPTWAGQVIPLGLPQVQVLVQSRVSLMSWFV